MRFADLKAKVRSLIWAAGEAENLTVQHDNMFQEALGFLQVNVPEEKDRNTDVYPFCSTFFKCGLTIVPAPIGVIKRVFTIANGNWCDPVYYDQNTRYEPERWSRNLLFAAKNTNFDMPEIPLGFQAADKSTDLIVGRSLMNGNQVSGRARRGIWSLDGRNIVVAPWLQSNESLVIVWKGTKQQWNDDDLVSDQIDVQKFIKLYVAWAHERDFGTDRQAKSDMQQDMAVALGDVMIEWKENTRIRKHRTMDWRERTITELQQSAIPTVVDPTTVFAQIGNYGVGDAFEVQIASIIASMSPSAVIAAGNNSLNGNYDGDVGQFFAKFIAPYTGAYGPGAETNIFWPCPGSVDWQPGSLAAYFSFFKSLNSQRYYKFCLGNVEFFMLDNTTSEPDGFTDSSSQAEWLRLQLALSVAKWKIVVGSEAPFSSNQSHGPLASAKWPFKTWGADLYISGGMNIYERLNVNGFPYIINGGSFQPRDSFGTPVDGSLVRNNTDIAVLKGVADGTTLTITVYKLNGGIIDTLILTK